MSALPEYLTASPYSFICSTLHANRYSLKQMLPCVDGKWPDTWSKSGYRGLIKHIIFEDNVNFDVVKLSIEHNKCDTAIGISLTANNKLQIWSTTDNVEYDKSDWFDTTTEEGAAGAWEYAKLHF